VSIYYACYESQVVFCVEMFQAIVYFSPIAGICFSADPLIIIGGRYNIYINLFLENQFQGRILLDGL